MVPLPTSPEEVRVTTFDADAKNDLGHTTDGRVTAADNGNRPSDPVDNAPDAVAMSESALAEAARKVADNPEVKLALQAVVDLAMANCECEGASVTLVGANGGAESTATSSNLIEKADDLQYAYDEGPCLRAAEDGGAFLILDTRTDPRFPGLGTRRGQPRPQQRPEHPPVHRPPDPRRPEPLLRVP